jgi:uncharacterized OsmC-like protein
MATQTAEKQKATIVNGVNVDQLFGNVDAIKGSPVLGKFKFRANNKWINGGLNKTTIKDFYGIQQNHDHGKHFELNADEPPVLLGGDEAPNPVEYALTALTSCVTTSIVYHAAAKGITLNSIETKLEGDIDLRGFLGISDEIRRGFDNIRMYFKIDADVPDEQLEDLIKLGTKYSPVFDTITNPVPVSAQLDK